MATSTFNSTLVGDKTSADSQKPGFFRRVLEQIAAVQTAKARRMTAAFMMDLSDEQLTSYGWSAQDIKRLRNI